MLTQILLLMTLGCSEEKEMTNSILDGDGDNSGVSGLDCQDNICILSGTIVDDITLSKDSIYLLRGGVFIGDDENTTILTIEAGTTVYGESSTDGMLVINRNSQIIAEGTAEEPIVFTSSKEPGS